jgi:hypothetical protein
MAKYQHHPDTKIVLEDIKNRLIQLQEANEKYREVSPELVEHQNTALQSAQLIVQQAIDNGHVGRGNEFFPDPVEPMAETPSPNETLSKEDK